MDLTQKKLSRAEWTNIEIMAPEDEKVILKLIIDGYNDINIKYNDTLSLLSTMKLDHTVEIEHQLYKQYFEKDISEMRQKYDKLFATIPRISGATTGKKPPALKTRDLIRIQSMDAKLDQQKGQIYEFIIIGFCQEIMRSLFAKSNQYAFYLYTLLQLKKATIPKINPQVVEFVDQVIAVAEQNVQMKDVLRRAYDFIEKNPHILKYEDRALYSHQKELFSIFRRDPTRPKLVLYTAPTGTGKTLSPLGLSEGHRVIFICAARHIGLALAKSAVSMGKRIAFAFGCETASDIRLHYFSISEHIIKRNRHGEIVYKKVDNSVGDKVQIMICDVQSYLIAMHYMMAFSPLQVEHPEYVPIHNGDDNELGEPNLWPQGQDADLITYWDEPTIAMDYEDHPLHELMGRNWTENRISKVVLSCATLPKEAEIMDTIGYFRAKFTSAIYAEAPEIHTINSYDCKKSIALLNKSGKSVVPHLLFRDFDQLQECVTHCLETKTLLRYFDLKEVIRLVEMAHLTQDALNPAYRMEQYFSGGISEITMNSIKLYYLEVLQRIDGRFWPKMYDELLAKQVPKIGLNNMIVKSQSLTSPPSVFTQSVFTQSVFTNSLAGQPLTRTQSVSTNSQCSNASVSASASTSVSASSSTSVSASSSVSSSVSSSAGILLTTQDAHTLTDGPTIFLCEDVEKVGKFYVQQSNIPDRVFQAIAEKIAHNSTIQQKMDELNRLIEDKMGADENSEQTKGKDTDKIATKSSGKSRKVEKDTSSKEVAILKSQFEGLSCQIKVMSLDNVYIPNTLQHQRIWVTSGASRVSGPTSASGPTSMSGPTSSNNSSNNSVSNAFVPSVDEDSVRDIMGLDVTDQMKLLLLLGIGMFVNEQTANPRYMEIMKRLANQQQLFLILASSDYIYGTNYQFCHGFIGKDLDKMTHQKTIQAMGRIGRGVLQQEYTVRFRDDTVLQQLFQRPATNLEAVVMSRLFSE